MSPDYQPSAEPRRGTDEGSTFSTPRALSLRAHEARRACEHPLGAFLGVEHGELHIGDGSLALRCEVQGEV
eukprot:CAMPEP_0198698970 /NCGR_PEP_ID=MMETSP1468-20131203/346254_1 /TAXON_ID=1461545 /ORGANISM="Mantoniella sp, Strain CCMP1436" /LENGTH=70 /DNA_ID=CAMNT_0044456271 /DNA_START=58 /DNA_END=270 /DNA_ORIENTATION=-